MPRCCIRAAWDINRLRARARTPGRNPVRRFYPSGAQLGRNLFFFIHFFFFFLPPLLFHRLRPRCSADKYYLSARVRRGVRALPFSSWERGVPSRRATRVYRTVCHCRVNKYTHAGVISVLLQIPRRTPPPPFSPMWYYHNNSMAEIIFTRIIIRNDFNTLATIH